LTLTLKRVVLTFLVDLLYNVYHTQVGVDQRREENCIGAQLGVQLGGVEGSGAFHPAFFCT